MKKIIKVTKKNMKKNNNKCPECGGVLVPSAGCSFCPNCGYSPCM